MNPVEKAAPNGPAIGRMRWRWSNWLKQMTTNATMTRTASTLVNKLRAPPEMVSAVTAIVRPNTDTHRTQGGGRDQVHLRHDRFDEIAVRTNLGHRIAVKRRRRQILQQGINGADQHGSHRRSVLK